MKNKVIRNSRGQFVSVKSVYRKYADVLLILFFYAVGLKVASMLGAMVGNAF